MNLTDISEDDLKKLAAFSAKAIRLFYKALIEEGFSHDDSLRLIVTATQVVKVESE